MGSRSYATGRTKAIHASGVITLFKTGGRYVRSDPADDTATSHPYSDGWAGSGFFHVLNIQDFGGPFPDDGHAVQISAFGFTARIATFLWDATVDGTGPGYVWRTEVTHNNGGTPVVVQRWDDPRVVGAAAVAPSSVTVAWQASFTAEEWLFEIDSVDGEDSRPIGAGNPRFYYTLKPVGLITSTVSGSTLTRSGAAVFGAEGARTRTHLSMTVSGTAQYSATTGDEVYPSLEGLNGVGPMPLGATFASAGGLALDGTIPHWLSSRSDPAEPGSLCATFDGLTWAKSRRYENLTAQAFTQYREFLASETIIGEHAYNVTIDGELRDWNGKVSGIPVGFLVYNSPCGGDAEKLYNFSGSHLIDGQPNPTIHPPAAYDPNDINVALIRLGSEWDALSLDRAAPLIVEDFSTIGGANGWAGTDTASGPAYASGKLTVTGDGSGSPRIDKELKSDFLDLWTDPGTWWTTHGGSLSALNGTQAAQAAAWWTATGDPASSPHVGDWYRIGRKLLSTSDVFNWSAWRYLDFKGYADVACDVTLRLEWDEFIFERDNLNPFGVDVTFTTKTATFTVSLTTASANHRIDLPSRCGHDGLRYVKSLRVTFPTGRTLNLESLTLVEVNRPTVDVHFPDGDIGYLSALADGKHALFLTPRHSAEPSSVWGWPVKTWRDEPDFSDFVSHLMDILAAELSLQEGWTASVAGSPDHGSPNYAVWLREAFEQPCPVTLKAQRSFGSGEVYPNFNQSLDMEANLGNALPVLVFDPDTFLPVKVPIEADFGSTRRDGAVTDAKGYARLETTKEEALTVYAAKGTADESSTGADTINRTWNVLALTGKEVNGAGGPCVLEIDRIGNQWVVFVRDGRVTLARKLGAAADWEYLDAFPGENPYLVVDETHAEEEIRIVFENVAGTLLQAANRQNGNEGQWVDLKIIAATASQPSVRKDKKTGRTYYVFWRSADGGTLLLKRSDDDGTTFVETAPGSGITETTVATGVAEQSAGIAFLTDATNTILVVYSDGSDIVSKTSVDDGRVWV